MPFDGSTYDPDTDRGRLSTRLALVKGGLAAHPHIWVTAEFLGAHLAIGGSVLDPRIRDLRKRKFGYYLVVSRRPPSKPDGKWEYRWTCAEGGTGDVLSRTDTERVAMILVQSWYTADELVDLLPYSPPTIRTLLECLPMHGDSRYLLQSKEREPGTTEYHIPPDAFGLPQKREKETLDDLLDLLEDLCIADESEQPRLKAKARSTVARLRKTRPVKAAPPPANEAPEDEDPDGDFDFDGLLDDINEMADRVV